MEKGIPGGDLPLQSTLTSLRVHPPAPRRSGEQEE